MGKYACVYACVCVHAEENIHAHANPIPDLRRCFDKVTFHSSTCKFCQGGRAAQLVHAMPKLVEKRLHLAVLQERCLFLGGLGEIADERSHGYDAPAFNKGRRLQAKAGGMAVLSLARMQVQVEVTHEGRGRRVHNTEHGCVLVP